MKKPNRNRAPELRMENDRVQTAKKPDETSGARQVLIDLDDAYGVPFTSVSVSAQENAPIFR